jgi:hypothetical protein
VESQLVLANQAACCGDILGQISTQQKIKELVDYPSINLKKKGVNISFLNWEGEAEPYDPFHEVWVNVEGIPFEWLGVLINVDCPVVFKNFYKKIRILVAVRDISKIPTSKLYEMEQEFLYLKFGVEKPTIEDLLKDYDNGVEMRRSQSKMVKMKIKQGQSCLVAIGVS